MTSSRVEGSKTRGGSSVFRRLSEAQMTQPGVTGDWSVKDILAVTTWEERRCDAAMIMDGQTPPRTAVSTVASTPSTRSERAEARSAAAEELAQLTPHKRLIESTARPDDLITRETRFRRRMRLTPTATTRSTPRDPRLARAPELR